MSCLYRITILLLCLPFIHSICHYPRLKVNVSLFAPDIIESSSPIACQVNGSHLEDMSCSYANGSIIPLFPVTEIPFSCDYRLNYTTDKNIIRQKYAMSAHVVRYTKIECQVMEHVMAAPELQKIIHSGNFSTEDYTAILREVRVAINESVVLLWPELQRDLLHGNKSYSFSSTEFLSFHRQYFTTVRSYLTDPFYSPLMHRFLGKELLDIIFDQYILNPKYEAMVQHSAPDLSRSLYFKSFRNIRDGKYEAYNDFFTMVHSYLRDYYKPSALREQPFSIDRLVLHYVNYTLPRSLALVHALGHTFSQNDYCGCLKVMESLVHDRSFPMTGLDDTICESISVVDRFANITIDDDTPLYFKGLGILKNTESTYRTIDHLGEMWKNEFKPADQRSGDDNSDDLL